MKKLTYVFLGIAIVWLIFYLGGSFIEASLDPSQWDKDHRATIGGIGLGISIVVGLIILLCDIDWD